MDLEEFHHDMHWDKQ